MRRQRGRSLCVRSRPTEFYRVGLLRIGPPPPSFIEPLRHALSEVGHVEGKSFVFDLGIAEDVEQLPNLAAELIRRKVDVILASGTPVVLPARNATSTVPVVIVAAIDPVETGVVTSLARPGGNVTGLTAVFADLVGKRLEMLKEMLPTLTRVALSATGRPRPRPIRSTGSDGGAAILRVELQVMSANSPDEFEFAFSAAQGVGAVIQIDDAMFTAHRQMLVDLATRHRIPGAYGLREFVDIGGFLAVGPSYSDLYRRSAAYLDKIHKGAKPADLPVEQANKFEMIVNLKTAKELGLTISPSLVARADEVIE